MLKDDGDTRTVSPNGQVTLPKEWREERGIEAKDQVAVIPTEEGTLEVIPAERD